MPKVSIIIPVYNGENYIRKCLDSILNQEYKDFEVLIVDDNSLDNSLSILKEYENNDNRVIVFHLDKNIGVSSGRNVALEKAKGEEQKAAKAEQDDGAIALARHQNSARRDRAVCKGARKGIVQRRAKEARGRAKHQRKVRGNPRLCGRNRQSIKRRFPESRGTKRRVLSL